MTVKSPLFLSFKKLVRKIAKVIVFPIMLFLGFIGAILVAGSR
jgi:hypothetical protein